MKKLLLLITALFLLISVEGQILRYNNYTAPPTGPIVLHDSLDASAYYLNARFLYGDGSATYMTDDGSVLTQWTDQSGSGNHLINASGTDRPSKDTSNEEIDFDGIDDVLVDATFAYSTAITIYMVVRINSAENIDDLIRLATSTTITIEMPVIADRDMRLFGGGSLFDTGNDFYPASGYFILCAVFNNDVTNGSSIQVNGGTAATGTLATATSTFIELPTQTGQYPDISVKELIIRTTADDASLRFAIISNLNAIYSVY